MNNELQTKQDLLRQKAEVVAKLNLLPYTGTVEIKENSSGKYLYVRNRQMGNLTSTYVGKFSPELYAALIGYAKDARALKKELRKLDKSLAGLGYSAEGLSARVLQNLDFARVNLKASIYDQAVLEGVATTYPQTETIIENGIVSGMTATDVQKILNLKHAWEFILDKDILTCQTDYYLLCHIAKLVCEGFYENGGKIRSVPVSIGGSSYLPPLPIEVDVKTNIDQIVKSNNSAINKAIDLCLYVMKTQIFNDGNKRSAVIFANHYLISQGAGLLIIPEADVPKFKELLVAYYEGENPQIIKDFLTAKAWKNF